MESQMRYALSSSFNDTDRQKLKDKKWPSLVPFEQEVLAGLAEGSCKTTFHLPGSGIASQFFDECSGPNGLPVCLLNCFASEGDNAGDALFVVHKLSQWLDLLPENKTTLPPHDVWRAPSSWCLLYGNESGGEPLRVMMDWPRSSVSQSMCIMDVTVTCPNFVDMEMFDYWIQGLSIAQTCSVLASDPSMDEFSLTGNMLTSHVRDHFTHFALLESGLRHPELFLQACAYRQLPVATRKHLVQKYYSIDEHLLRELVGRKLSAKTRRELSEIAERCDLRVRSCKRQFDNLLCVARRTEDLPGRLVDNIKTHFLLPDFLCECYAAVVFILNNRFDVQKRSLAYITFGDLVYCAGQLMSQWTTLAKDTKSDAAAAVDLDLQFFHDLREVKSLAEKKEYLDKHKTLVARALYEAKATHIPSTLDTNFKSISKAIITIACGLTHAKEMRDFFLDIVEKLIEPMRVLGWPPNEVKLFFDAYGSAASHVPPTKSIVSAKSMLRYASKA
ncbi:unnamed protein product [Echinostoma caproni]|uniref:MYND-type domain-containing protein n=1 Tax=Echinostoma caproni TaxID=27848 RepID=A0A183AD76_9TREM|nr:unnamed protein product [Echinostoma caproni]